MYHYFRTWRITGVWQALLKTVREQVRLPRLQHLWVDGGYRTTFVTWVKEQLGWRVQRVQHPNAGSRRRITMLGVEPAPIDRSFKVIPRVERTYGWGVSVA